MDSVIGAALEILLTVTGRVVVWVFSFARWRGEPLTGEERRVHGAAGALSFVRDGRRVFTHTGQIFAGIAFYVALAAAGILMAALSVVHPERDRFDSAAWKARADVLEQTNDSGCFRGGMAIDLIETNALLGASATEVVSLLGNPESSDGSWTYWVGQCGLRWEHNALVITFDAGAKVKDAAFKR